MEQNRRVKGGKRKGRKGGKEGGKRRKGKGPCHVSLRLALAMYTVLYCFLCWLFIRYANDVYQCLYYAMERECNSTAADIYATTHYITTKQQYQAMNCALTSKLFTYFVFRPGQSVCACQICCHQMAYFKAKMHQIRFRLGLGPRPRWGSLQRSPRPPGMTTYHNGPQLTTTGHNGLQLTTTRPQRTSTWPPCTDHNG